MSVLSLIIFLPILFGGILLCIPQSKQLWYKYVALAGAVLQLALTLVLYVKFDTQPDPSLGSLQWAEKMPWIQVPLGDWGTMQIEYFVGVDGISIAFLPLTAFIMCIATLASWKYNYPKGYFALILLLNTSIIGVFVAMDFFLFFTFYELMLLPLYFLVGVWGGARREYAALKFFLYTLLGSVFMLLVMIALSLSALDPETGFQTFNLIHLSHENNFIANSLLDPNHSVYFFGWSARTIAFWILFVAFAIKIPVVPLHTWLPDAHVEAPTPVSIILAGILLKVGGYGLIRIVFAIFPEMAFQYSHILGMLGLISIIYGGLNALAMKDLKRLVAYSSISHMGFVLVGIASLTTEGLSAAIFQMISHGILSTMLFFAVGVLYDRVHNREIDNFKGLASLMPKYTTMVMIAFFASLGIPGFSAFIGEAFSIFGAFEGAASMHTLNMWIPILMPLGLVLGAAYLLWTLQRMFFGTLTLAQTQWRTALVDLSKRELGILGLLACCSLSLGLMPSLIFNKINTDVVNWIQMFLR